MRLLFWFIVCYWNSFVFGCICYLLFVCLYYLCTDTCCLLYLVVVCLALIVGVCWLLFLFYTLCCLVFVFFF